MLGPADLVSCSANLMHAPLRAKLELAEAGGFRGISLWPTDYQQARDEGLSDAGIRRLLADHRVEIAELDTLLGWLPGGEPAPGLSARERAAFGASAEEFFAIADALGARSINAALADPRPVALDAVADAFGALCERAAAHDLLVTLEFLPWTAIRDAATAAAIVERAGCPNGGVMLDAWHWFRSAAPLASIPAARVLGVQLCDAPAQAEADLIEETLHRRLAPGDGDADLAGLLRHLTAGGCTAPIGIEVFSDAVAAQPLRETAQQMARAARRILEAAR